MASAVVLPVCVGDCESGEGHAAAEASVCGDAAAVGLGVCGDVAAGLR